MKLPDLYHNLYAEYNENSSSLISIIGENSPIEVVTTETAAGARRLTQYDHFYLYSFDL